MQDHHCYLPIVAICRIHSSHSPTFFKSALADISCLCAVHSRAESTMYLRQVYLLFCPCHNMLMKKSVLKESPSANAGHHEAQARQSCVQNSELVAFRNYVIPGTKLPTSPPEVSLKVNHMLIMLRPPRTIQNCYESSHLL